MQIGRMSGWTQAKSEQAVLLGIPYHCQVDYFIDSLGIQTSNQIMATRKLRGQAGELSTSNEKEWQNWLAGMNQKNSQQLAEETDNRLCNADDTAKLAEARKLTEAEKIELRKRSDSMVRKESHGRMKVMIDTVARLAEDNKVLIGPSRIATHRMEPGERMQVYDLVSCLSEYIEKHAVITAAAAEQ